MGNEPRLGSKVFYKIGEVSKIAKLPAYVLRFWESEFSFLKPKKSRGNQRLYVQRDVDTVLEIKRMLYEEGHTLAGVKRYWARRGVVGPGGASLPIDILLRDDGAAIDGTVDGMPAAPAGALGPIAIVRSGPNALPAAPYVYCIPLRIPRPFHGKLGLAPGDVSAAATSSGRLSRAGLRPPARRTRISECRSDEQV